MAETAHPKHEIKACLRRRLLAARDAVVPEVRRRQDVDLARNLKAWLDRHPVAMLAVFWPIRGEPDLRELYATLAADGVRLALPIVTDRASPLLFAAWTPGELLLSDRLGIAIPVQVRPVVPEALVIPCVGFNPQGYRLGFGGGFYDRTLAQTPRPRAIGVACTAARVHFDADAHDIPMDVVITEATPE